MGLNSEKKQVFNPYLPGWEYIPDAEPHVFDGRLYIFGSHDAFAGSGFCVNDYVCWSAPVEDLADWRYEGVIYKKTQDPMNPNGARCLFAPDVAKGPDGRYYLYYTLDFLGITSVAVAPRPAGPYEYYGAVRWPDGRALGAAKGEPMQYDPGVLVDDDGRIHLYSGVAPNETLRKKIEHLGLLIDGCYHMELEPDMLTIRCGPTRVLAGAAEAMGTGFENHTFFEASSMRKIGGIYYLIYSSQHNYELCYAVSGLPDGGFTFGGTLVSLGDVFLDGRPVEKALNYLGNTHGSIEQVDENWYVFYHRHTNLNQFSRQACAEPITIAPNGHIAQMEMTSCGLNGGPLVGRGRYEARIACNLMSAKGADAYRPVPAKMDRHPYFTQDGPDGNGVAHQYIANLQNGSVAGFKYFEMNNASRITVRYRTTGEGLLLVSTKMGGPPMAQIIVHPGKGWQNATGPLASLKGRWALYFTYLGTGRLDFDSFILE